LFSVGADFSLYFSMTLQFIKSIITNKPTETVAVLFWCMYTCFSLYFAQERICFADAASTLVQIINTKQFVVQLDRYPAMVTQILPVLGVHLHCSIACLIILYSLNFSSLSVVFYTLLHRLHKGLAFVWLLFFLALMGPSFYYPHNELFVGNGLALVALACSIKPQFKYLAIAILLLLAAVFTHLTTVPVIAMGLLVLALSNNYSGWRLLHVLIAFIVVLVIKAMALQHNWYDSARLLDTPIPESIQQFMSYHSIAFLGTYIKDWGLYSTVVILAFVLLSRQKAWLKLLAVLCTLVYLALACTMYYTAADIPHLESELLPAVLILGLIITGLKQRMQAGLCCVLLMVFCARVYSSGMVLNNQKRSQVSKLLQNQQMGITKAAIALDIHHQPFAEVWAIGYETLLLSKMHTTRSATFYVLDATDAVPKVAGIDALTLQLLNASLPAASLNTEYFPWDSSRYTLMHDSFLSMQILK
jgi:hypothetical protein